MSTSLRIVSRSLRRELGRRSIQTSSSVQAISSFSMPAMSPTMTEGGLAAWKVKEGDKFAAGDVLLEIETDKATMDVEAQDDGVMAKIVVNDGAKGVPVGKVIAMLAEEGDDISNVEAPAEDTQTTKKDYSEKNNESSSSSSPSPSSSQKSDKVKSDEKALGAEPKHVPQMSIPVMPSVMRILADFNVSSADAESIKGTGVRGRLTKGDVLTYLGKAQGPTGTFKEDKRGISAQGGAAAPAAGKSASQIAAAPQAKSEPLTGNAVRSMILSGLASSSHASRAKELAAAAATTSPMSVISRKSTFDELLDDYQFKSASTKLLSSSKSKDPFQGLL